MNKRLIVIGAAVTALIIGLLIILNSVQNGALEVTAPGTPSNEAVTMTITYDNGKTENFSIASNSTKTFSLRTGTHRIKSSVGILEVIDIVKISATNTTKLNLSFGTQLSSTKIGTDAEYCPYIVGDVVYSYNCQGDGFIYRHPSPVARKIPMLAAQPFGRIEPYQTGFLGFPKFDLDTSKAGSTLHFINLQNQTMTKIVLPSALQVEGVSEKLRIVTTGDPAKPYFALMLKDTDAIYLFKTTADKNPIKLTLSDPKALSTDGNVNSLTLTDKQLVLFTGRQVRDEHNDGQVNDGATHSAPVIPKSNGRIFEYNLDGTLADTLSTPDDFEANTVTKLADNYYAARHGRGIDVYYSQNKILGRVYRLADAKNVLVAGSTLYLQVDLGIFTFQPETNGTFSLKNIYNPSDVTVSRLFNSQRGLLFTGFSATTTTNAVATLDIFQLTK